MADQPPTQSQQPPLPLLTKFKLCLLSLFRHVYTRPNGTINHCLYDLFDKRAPAPTTKLINNIHVTNSDVHIDPSRSLWFRLFVPDVNSLLPLIVYYHGGGFSKNRPNSASFDRLCSHLAAKVPAVVVSVNYRLTPEHKYPSQYDDGYDALRFIDAETTAVLPAYTDTSRCFIGGDSAGGNITHHVAVRAVNNAEHFSNIRITGVVALQPFFGGEERTESELRLTRAPIINVKLTDIMWRDFLPEGADRNHPAAHVFGGEAAQQLKNLDFPSILVILGGYDPLQDWQRRYVEWLESCGKEVEVTMYPNAFHGVYGFPELPEFELIIQRVAIFIQKQVHPN